MPRLVESPVVPTSQNSLLPRYDGYDSGSVKLSCLSPNGRAVHSFALVDGLATIETRSLPLPGSLEEEAKNRDDATTPTVVSTTLPERIQHALERYKAIELLCVDVDSPAASTDSHQGRRQIPLLCLYTSKDAFLIELSYAETGHSGVEGEVESVIEPFDDALLGTSTFTSIVKIRCAPQRSNGYVTMCPPGCMAALTHNSMTNEYSIVLYQGNGLIETPLAYGMEQLEEQDEQITDFCFCKSDAFSLLSSLSILLLKGTGDVLLATPILFRGTVVPRSIVVHTLDYFDVRLKQLNSSSAAWRQHRTAKQFLVDIFPDDGRSYYVTAQARSEAFQWPVQMQGPVLVAAESDMFMTIAASIEPVPAGDLLGVAIAHLGHVVDFGILSPSTFIARFKLERDEDTCQLDNDLRWGPILQRMDFESDGHHQHQVSISTLALIPDPVLDTVVHYVTPTEVRSVSTNVLKITAKKVQDRCSGKSSSFNPSTDQVARTTAWSSLDTSFLVAERTAISGVVVTSDAHLGHVLVSRLSNGCIVPVNLTETRHFHDMDNLIENGQGTTRVSRTSASDQSLASIQASTPLHEVMAPLLDRVTGGLAGLGKFVGTSTEAKDITPDLLAVAMSVKERCENNMVLPLLEINQLVAARRKHLEAMCKDQLNQLAQLRETVETLKQRMGAMREKAEEARSNAALLAQRSSRALQSSSDLLPTLTQAEFDYFQELKRLDTRTKVWQEEFDSLKKKATNVAELVTQGQAGTPLDLPSNIVNDCKMLMKASGTLLKKQANRLNEAGHTLNDVSIVVGLEIENDKPMTDAQ